MLDCHIISVPSSTCHLINLGFVFFQCQPTEQEIKQNRGFSKGVKRHANLARTCIYVIVTSWSHAHTSSRTARFVASLFVPSIASVVPTRITVTFETRIWEAHEATWMITNTL